MLVLAIADKAPKNNILDIVNRNPIDLICTLGDLNYSLLKELENIKNIPKIGVYGNHCSGKYFDSLNIINLHLATFEHKSLIFGGFEGSLKYKKSDHPMYSQKEAQELLKDFPYVDVFIAHSPAFGINDEAGDPTHEGLIALREYIEQKKPKYFLHGHTYPTKENLVTKHEDTNIIYVYEDKIIEL
ncbi:MAG: metallophosphoesterase [Patescibacteria group bacterium]|nr:metallophosphoesterase [Patescibacteria group bacterium]